ncbi:MAG: sigma-70 family RNA polymerase sigma factor, partial [Planctomycetes bacterium]|nr:sigma-70 family RNA polymerase sigma factor [Planctomycetota bacterium]
MTATASTDDDLLVSYARSGDRTALDALLRRHLDVSYRVAKRITGNGADAEDAVQAAFMRVLADAQQFRGESSAKSWLLAVVVHAAIKHARGERRRRRHERASAPAPVPDTADGMSDVVRSALDELPEHERLPVVLRYLEDLPFKDVAEALRIPEGTAKAQVHRGLERMRSHLARLGYAMQGGSIASMLIPGPLNAAPPALAQAIGGLSPATGGGTAGIGSLTAIILAGTVGLAGVAAVVVSIRPQPSAAMPVATEIRIAAGEDIQAAVDRHPPGTRFLLGAGIHRQQIVQPKDGDGFTGEPGAVMSGARVLTGFVRDGSHWIIAQQSQRGQVHGTGDAQHPGAPFPEDLFLDDRPLTHVRSMDAVGTGTWYFDYDAQRIVLGEDPQGRQVETSVSESAFSGPAERVMIRGLAIERYAAPAQSGAIGGRSPGSAWTIDHCEIQGNHGAGIRIAARWSVAHCQVRANGQLGIGGNGDGVVVEDNDIADNNVAGFDPGWEAGGAKFAHCAQLRFTGNRVIGNHGIGVLIDADSDHARCAENVVSGNGREGLIIGSSEDALITGNRFEANGRERDGWLWGSQILVRNARGCEVSGNTLVIAADHGSGIGIMQQASDLGADQPRLARDNRIHDNDITCLGSPVEIAGVVADHLPDAAYASGNRFDGNHYHVRDPAAAAWAWGGRPCTWAEFRAGGQEGTGTV